MIATIVSFLFASAFFVEFDHKNCTSTFILSIGDHIALSRTEDYVQLTLVNNSDFQQYTLITDEIKTFEWPSMKLNGVKMIPRINRGNPVNKTSESVSFFCPIRYLSNLEQLSVDCNTTEEKITNLNCRWDDTSAVGLSAVTAIVFLSLFLGLHPPEKVVSLFRKRQPIPVEEEDFELEVEEIEELNKYK